MKANPIIIITILLLCTPLTLAIHNQPYHLKLLAVQESEKGYEGSDADLYLEIKQGSGRVFLDTYPVTKMDTQISTRFAKEIACAHFKINCEKYDFIYTIKAETSTVGGPSAGAAIATLTSIALLDLKYDDAISISGTINSGSIIGPVGGIKEKLEAASHAGLQKVLIAKSSSTQTIPTLNNISEKNLSIVNETELDLITYAKQNLSLEVIEVLDLEEAIYHMTGVNLTPQNGALQQNNEYKGIMKGLQQQLCERTTKIKVEMQEENIHLNATLQEPITQREGKAKNATEKEEYYAAASYCFGNNIALKNHYYQQKKVSKSLTNSLFSVLEKRNSELAEQLKKQPIATISDLQVSMIVKERINEVKESIKRYKERKIITSEEVYATIAYAEERYYSAISWMEFFAMNGKKFSLTHEKLKALCNTKILESEERFQYTSLFLGQYPILTIQEKINTAKTAFEQEEYDLCLTTASQAKADANAVLSSIGLNDKNVADFFQSKKKIAERVIAENSKEGIFPILGYSYYEYANSLKAQEPYTALVYIEYALELSDLSMYFPEERELKSITLAEPPNNTVTLIFIEGVAIGIVLTIIIIKLYLLREEKKVQRKKKKEFEKKEKEILP